MELITKFTTRLSAFLDKSAWILVIIGALILGFTDGVLLGVLVKWTSFMFIVAGLAIVLSKLVFPTISFSAFIEYVKAGNIAAGMVMAAVILFVAMAMYTVVFWAKG